MSKEEKNNKIALFMGHTSIRNNKEIQNLLGNRDYHNSWSELMSVITFIKQLNLEDPSMTDKIDFYLLGCNLEYTYEAVLDFIEEFNKN